MLTGIHILLTFMCNFACDQCFVFSGPNAKGTFTLSQLHIVLDEATKLGTIEWVFFEGGEPFLFYPTMIEGIRIARSKALSGHKKSILDFCSPKVPIFYEDIASAGSVNRLA